MILPSLELQRLRLGFATNNTKYQSRTVMVTKMHLVTVYSNLCLKHQFINYCVQALFSG